MSGAGQLTGNAELSGAIADAVGQAARAAADAPGLYAALRRDGWTTVGIAEGGGGSGGDLADAAEVAAAITGAGAGLPVADTAIVAARLLTAGGIRLPETARCVVPACAPDAVVSTATTPAGTVSAHLRRVPWASWASHLVLACPAGQERTSIVLLETAGAAISRGANLANEPRDDIRFTDAPATGVVTIDRQYCDIADEVRAAGALARSVQMAAAAQQVLEMTSRYCTERVQFGRPLAAWQAVQQQLAELAAETAAARAAAALAVAAVTGERAGSRPAPVTGERAGSLINAVTGAVTEIAMAKARTSQAAGHIARIAHQLHGAIGVTREHPLQRYSRALWSWREEYGTQAYWSQVLATRLAGHEDDLWGWLTARDLEPGSATRDTASGRPDAARLRARERGTPVVGGGFDEPVRCHLQHGTARA
ncbi:MAG: acyl-CoA/acyl-ACP dehydrogenase [Actinomycetota bacterium]|nr:acyl-CoA/acyl-ACP dehydrogenase [Actinomycetota bacterium]